jgi:hypothetical protein
MTTTITRTACPSWCDARHDDELHRVFLFDADPLCVWLVSYENDGRPDIAVRMGDDGPEEYLSLRMAAELIGRLSEAVVKALELEGNAGDG